MISFTNGGLAIGDSDWTAASPSAAGIEIRFRDGSKVWLSRMFVEHAHDLLNLDTKSTPQTSEEGKTK